MYGKMQESGLTEITPWICTSAIWGQSLLLSHPEFLPGAPCGWLQELTARWQVFFSSLNSFRARQLTDCGLAIADDCDILCLLIWQAIF